MKKLLFASVVALAAAAAVYQFAPGKTENVAVSVSTETSAPANVEAPHTVNATSTFARRAEEVQASLPTLDKIKSLTEEEVHSTPTSVMEAGLKLGELAEAIEKDPSLAPEGIAFYGKCARRGDISSSVRALCLSDLRDLSKKRGQAADESGIPAEITRMAAVLKGSK